MKSDWWSQVLLLDYWNNVMHFKATWGPEQGYYGVPRASYDIQVKETHWHFRLFKLCLLARCTWIPICRAFHSIRTWLDWLRSTGLNLTEEATLTSVSTISVPPKSTVTSTSPSPSHSTSSFRSQGSKDVSFLTFSSTIALPRGIQRLPHLLRLRQVPRAS